MTRQKSVFMSMALLWVSIAMLACGGGLVEGRRPGQEVIDWVRPDEEPAWIDKEPGAQGSVLQFVGLVDRAKREQLGRTDARMNARIALARSVASRIASEYGVGREDDRQVYVQEAAEAIADATIRSAMSKEWFTVHFYIVPQAGGTLEYFYKIYVLMEIPLADFAKSKESALMALESEETPARGREVYERLREDVRSGAWPYRSR